jgi:hypothetical protein
LNRQNAKHAARAAKGYVLKKMRTMCAAKKYVAHIVRIILFFASL